MRFRRQSAVGTDGAELRGKLLYPALVVQSGIYLSVRAPRPKVDTQPEGLLHRRLIPDGAYAVRWTDTLTGDLLRCDTVEVSAGNLVMPTPAIAKAQSQNS